jgi:hypothetical protein
VGAVQIAWLLMLGSHEPLWRIWNWTLQIPMWPVFADLHVILEGVRLSAAGVDPLSVDPTLVGITYNYPRAWLLLKYIGAHRLDLQWIGVAMNAVWLATLVFALRIRSLGLALALTFALFSPPIMLAMERANCDLVLMMICIAAVWTVGRGPAWLSPGLIAAGAILKLYPAAAFLLLVRELSPRRRSWWLAAAAAVAIFWLLHLPELKLVGERTPHVSGASFGCAVITMRYAHFVTDILDRELSNTVIIGSAIGAYALYLPLAAWLGLKLAPEFRQSGSNAREESLFCLSAAICCGTFALGANFSYRLIFLLPSLPFIWRAFRQQTSSFVLCRWAAVTLIAAGLMLFAELNGRGQLFIIAQIAAWITVGSLATAFCGINASFLQALLPGKGAFSMTAARLP